MVAERFFDTFLNVEKFQYHDACQGLMRANQQLERERRKNMEIERMNNLQINESKAMKHDHTFEDYIYDHYTIADGELFEPFSLG
jgi:hypothetical protein